MPAQDTRGFALIEIMVAAVVLITVALATLALVDAAQSESGQTRLHSAAVAVAHSDLEQLRHLATSDLNGSYDQKKCLTRESHVEVLCTDPKAFYTVRSQAVVTGDGASDVACTTDPSQAEYLHLTSTVTWPGIGGARPVVLDTLLAPPVKLLSSTTGSLTYKLQTEAGSAVPNNAGPGVQGVVIKLTGPQTYTATTNSLGCATFALIPGGSNYTASYAVDGYVNPSGAKDISAPATVNAGGLLLVKHQYDQAATVNVSFDAYVDKSKPPVAAAFNAVEMAAAGLTSPRTFGGTATATGPVSRSSSGQGGGDSTGVAANTISATKLYPYSTGYGTFAGNCAGNDPSRFIPDYFTRVNGQTSVTPGGTSSVKVHVPVLLAQVTENTGHGDQPIDGRYSLVPNAATDVNMGGCATYRGSFSAGNALIPVPFGNWKICVDDGAGHKITTPQPLSVKSVDPTSVALPVDPGTSGSC